MKTIFLKLIKKYRKVNAMLKENASAKNQKRLLRKKDILFKRIRKMNSRLAIPLSMSLLLSFSNAAYAQDNLDLVNDPRVSIINPKKVYAITDINNDGFNDYFGIIDWTSVYCRYGDGELNIDTVDVNNIASGDGFYLMGTPDSELDDLVHIDDINGDGINDIAIFDYAEVYYTTHNSYVIFGSNTPFPDAMELESISQGDGLILQANPNGNHWGEDITSGDLNGDGASDLVLGTFDVGGVEVFYGKPGGFSELIVDWSNIINGVDGTMIHAQGQGVGLTGYQIAVPGDINGDDKDDLVMAAYHDYGFDADPDTMSTVFVVYGASDYGVEFNINQLDGSNGFKFDVEAPALDIGSAGDINSDSLADFFVSPHSIVALPMIEQNSYVIYGDCDSTMLSYNLDSLVFFRGMKIPLTSLDGHNDVSDNNGDGFGDLYFYEDDNTYILDSEIGISHNCESISVGIGEVENEKETIVLYPNPASEKINLAINNLRKPAFRIFNSEGIFMGHYSSEEIDISKYPNGLYVMVFANGESIRFVKSN